MGSYESAVSYDSTWEEDEDNVEAERSRVGSTDAIYPKSQKTVRNMTPRRPSAFNYKYMYSEDAHIMCNYRNYSQPSFSNYQSIEAKMPNLMFYRNQKKFEPDGLKIDDLLSDWKDKYDVLEMNHCYIQWLFPNREPGKNPNAHPLHEKEIEMMQNDKDVKRRLREAYQMMLGFYGLQLLNEDSGQVGRAENWKERYRNLDRNSHNNLRITRILMCLGDLGYEHYQEPLIRFFLEETLRHGNLQNVKRSVLDYYVFSVRDKKARQRLVQMAWDLYEPKSQFIWGPVEVLQKNSPTTSQSTYKGDPNYVVASEEDIPSSYCCSCNCKM